ncbi:hypothetical protein CR161_07175 [Prosthecochloris sp. ZM]|uniref:Uncharacterized protein n=2 Tax=Chlorobiaceae TaxID=191412 RepID=B4S7D4_PROA2|nr:conserved hypothetical protein [Prosthecochloris aestuarii DSM 271]RDD30513.1 hypothetical protein CR161_07175 [Prosthecochloris sp. ZM]
MKTGGTMQHGMPGNKPYRIVIEWSDHEDFYFSCDYRPQSQEKKVQESRDVHAGYCFPHVTRAMGNVLKKLRREPIVFPVFLLSLAFDHRHLLNEIELLLHGLHRHLQQESGAGRFSCFIVRDRDHAAQSSSRPSSSRGG